MKGKITISRTQSNKDNPRPIHIAISDCDAVMQFIDLRMSLDDFAKAITGQGRMDCEFNVMGLDKIGMIRELKHEMIPTTELFTEKKDIPSILAPFEIDGWVGSEYDLENHHNKIGNSHKVSFVRWVEKE